MNDYKDKLIDLQSGKFILAVIGDANAGKTTTINKIYNTLKCSSKISSISNIWGTPSIDSPTWDFSLTGVTKFGLTGILSKGDQICYLYDDLKQFVGVNAEVIICACRKSCPDTYKSIARISWESQYNIIWFDLSCSVTMTRDICTDILALKISSLF